jgi:hypothetical protein
MIAHLETAQSITLSEYNGIYVPKQSRTWYLPAENRQGSLLDPFHDQRKDLDRLFIDGLKFGLLRCNGQNSPDVWPRQFELSKVDILSA